MASSFIDQAHGMITPEVIDKVAASTGESPENTGKAIRGAFATVLAGFTRRAATPEGSSDLLRTLHEGDFRGAAERFRAAAEGKHEAPIEAHALFGKVFGERSASAGDALAEQSGVKPSSALRILALAAPVVAGALVPEVCTAGAIAGLAEVLASHTKSIIAHPSTPPEVRRALAAEALPIEGASKRDPRAAARPALAALAGLAAVVLLAWGAVSLLGLGPSRTVRIGAFWSTRRR